MIACRRVNITGPPDLAKLRTSGTDTYTTPGEKKVTPRVWMIAIDMVLILISYVDHTIKEV